MKGLVELQLQRFFKYAELTEVIRQNDKLFVELFYKFRVRNIDEDLEELLKLRFIGEYYPKVVCRE